MKLSAGTLGGGEDPHRRLETAFAGREKPHDPFPVVVKMPLVEVAIADGGEYVKHGPAAKRQQAVDHEIRR